MAIRFWSLFWTLRVRAIVRLWIAVLFLGVPTNALALSELRELYRGTRAQAMGNAFVAIADDEEAIFLNPAGLAGVEKFRMNWMTGDLDVSDEAIYTTLDNLTSASDFSSSFSASNLNRLQGKNVYGRYQVTPGFVMKNFGISVLFDGQAALRTKNKALPQIELGYQFTNGAQMGVGFSLLSGKRTVRKNDLRLGFAAKILYRRGGYHLLSPSQLINLNKSTLSAMTGEYKPGYGGDVGVQYIRKFSPTLKGALGAAITDIGDTQFDKTQEPVRMNMSVGSALTYESGRWKITLAYDLRHINEDQELRKKTHLGMELGLPILSLYGGLNQMHLTYGLLADIKAVRVTAVTYSEEIGSYVGQDPEKRYLINVQVRLGF